MVSVTSLWQVCETLTKPDFGKSFLIEGVFLHCGFFVWTISTSILRFRKDGRACSGTIDEVGDPEGAAMTAEGRILFYVLIMNYFIAALIIGGLCKLCRTDWSQPERDALVNEDDSD